MGTICYDLRDALRIHTAIKSEAVSCLITLVSCKNLTVYLKRLQVAEFPCVSKQQTSTCGGSRTAY